MNRRKVICENRLWVTDQSKKRMKKIMDNPKHGLNIHLKAFFSGEFELKGDTGFYKEKDVKDYEFTEEDLENYFKSLK